MAKEVKEQKTPKKGIGTRDWRGSTVFFCLTPGCVTDSESKAVMEGHIRRGQHRVIAHTKPTAAVTAPQADEDTTTEGDS